MILLLFSLVVAFHYVHKLLQVAFVKLLFLPLLRNSHHFQSNQQILTFFMRYLFILGLLLKNEDLILSILFNLELAKLLNLFCLGNFLVLGCLLLHLMTNRSRMYPLSRYMVYAILICNFFLPTLSLFQN